MDNNETPDAIVAEMRRKRYPSYDYVAGDIEAILRHWADRLEAALKREQIGRDTLSDGRSLTVAVAEQRLHFARVEAEYAGMLNMAKARKALEAARAALSSYADGGDEDNAETNAVLAEIDAALAAPPRNCDLIANELQIDPDKVPDEINKCAAAPIRKLIRWIFAKAEGRRGKSKPTPEESAVAAVARNVAADMRCMELKCWKGRRMGAYAVALMLGAYASRLEDAYNRPPRKEGGAE